VIEVERNVLERVHKALQRADSRLSLLRHRAVRPEDWGSIGIGPAYEYDEVIGEARRMTDTLKHILARESSPA
jgi:hypothetical protein